MSFLRNLVDQGRRLYAEPGSRFHKIWPLFDAGETFLFTPGHTTPKHGPHVRDYMDLKRTMSMVIVAMLPCLLWSFYNVGLQHFAAVAQVASRAIGAGGSYEYTVGWLQSLVFGSGYGAAIAADEFHVGLVDELVFGLQRMLPLLLVSYGVGLSIEAAFAVMRKEEVSEGYLVSGMLIALIVPASVPLWQLALAVAFSVILAKEVFGGTGMNIFNVAMMARAFLFFAYPAQLSGDFVWVAGNDAGGAGSSIVDGYSGPTALAAAAASKLQGNHLVPDGAVGYFQDAAHAVQAQVGSWWDLFIGTVPGSAGETSALCALIGALILVATGVGSWRTMVGGVIGLAVMAGAMNVFFGQLDGIGGYPIHWHLVSGGFAFGIVYMATDPVTSPQTDRGKWIYGFLIGLVTVLVRCVNPAYPEGVMLAVLLLNAFAPTIDYFIVRANIRRRVARLG
ncbi:MAG: NADH:ubiquinone reductase (Na(+)-transporting) subunit B [Planctomycetes bacterium]|nr:NADH:ubiquinone reductase (Na(+)-transporting) subunit B [Planctomycetota bacterium]